MRAWLAAVTLACAACGGGSKKPAPVANTASGGGEQASVGKPSEPPGDARVIQRTANGGTLELIGNHGDAMIAAHKELDAHCGPGNATITQEGEEVVGDSDANPPKTAWRVHYSCGSGAVPPAAP